MPTTWDPAHKDAAIALSGGNLIATSSAGAGVVNSAVYATVAISTTVKQYFEVTVTGTMGTYLSVGVINGSASLSANIGTNNGAALVNSLFAGATRSYINNVQSSAAYPLFSAGQVIRVAIDRAANKIWWAINNNTWSGSAVWMGDGTTSGGTFPNDPASGTGGLGLSAVTGTIFPAFSSAYTGDVGTLNTGATAFTYAVPSGFVGADGGGGGGTTQAARAMVLA